MSFILLLSIIFTMCVAPTFVNSIQVTRDVEIDEWKQIAYFSHDAVDKISTTISLSGGTISIKSLIGIMVKAVEDGGHQGAYLHRYGNNNVFRFSHKEDLDYK